MNFDKGELDVLEDAVKTYGSVRQITKAIEEMSELIKELCKDGGTGERVDLIAEEIADVEIMLEQLKCIYRRSYIEFYIFRWKDAKINSLRSRLEKEKAHEANFYTG